MTYQLPTGETIEIPLDEYLAISDASFDRYIRQGRFTSKTNVQLSHSEYKGGSGSQKEIDWSNYQDDENIELVDNRTLNQIIDAMPDDSMTE